MNRDTSTIAPRDELGWKQKHQRVVDARKAAVEDVECETCGAVVGQPCCQTNGTAYLPKHYVHTSRLEDHQTKLDSSKAN